MRAARQTTLREQVTVSGIGVHSGLPVNLTLNPADADTGIVFSRTDADGREREVRADYRAVTATELATAWASTFTNFPRCMPPTRLSSSPAT